MFNKKKKEDKLCSNQTFFISLENFSNVDILNDIILLIWKYEQNIMTKKKVGS
jgi:hypothetical protein